MSDDEKPVIKPIGNGPLKVTGVEEFVLPDGTKAEPKPARFLCRCGQSKNKPYCDNSHKAADFDSTTPDVTARDMVVTYEGAAIAVHYNRMLCSHAAECSARLLPVFDPSRRPWIVPDNGTAEAIHDVVRACPSGALRYSEAAGEPQHLTGDAPRMTVARHGPYHVENIELEGARWANGATPKKYVLCRCGKSGNKPFCDGSHHDAGWRDDQ